MFRRDVFIIASNWKQPKCPTSERVNNAIQLRDENEYTNDACDNLDESQRHQDERYCIIKMVWYYFVYRTASKRHNYS